MADENQRIVSLQRQVEYMKLRNKLEKDFVKQIEKESELAEVQVEIGKEYLKDKQESVELAAAAVKSSEELLESLKKQGKELTSEFKARTNILEADKENLKTQIEILEAEKEKNKAAKELNDIIGKTENIVGTLTGISSQWQDTYIGSVIEASKTSGGFSVALANIGKGMQKTLTPSNMLASSLMKMQEATLFLVYQQESALSQFNRTTAAAGEYNSMIRDLGISHLDLAIDTQEAAEAIMSMREEFTDFTLLGRAAQQELALLSATMNEFGVSTQTTAQNMQIMVKGMGLSVEEAITAQKEIAATSIALGISVGKMADDFATAGPRLAAFGDQAIEKFRELATVAKATGIEMNNLIDISEQFDTFEGAANAVGSLNAILKGPFLDSMQLMSATDPTERIKLLRQAIDDAGMSFDNMGFFQRKAVASAAGLKDVEELSRLMSGSIEDMSEAAQKDALSKEEMEKTAKAAASIMEKFTNIMMSFAVSLGPAIDGLKWVADRVLSLNKALGGYLMPTLTALTAAWVLYRKIGLASFLLDKLRLGFLFKWVAGLWSKTAATTAAATAETAAAGATATFGTAATVASPGLLSFGLALLMIGGAVALVGLGIKFIIDAFANFLGVILENTDAVGEFAGSMMLLMPGAMFASIGVAALAASFMALAFSLAFIKTADLEALGVLFTALSGLTNETVSALNGVALAIEKVTSALDGIPETKTIAFATSMEKMIDTAVRVNPETVKNTEALVNSAIRYNQSQTAATANAVSPIVNLLSTSEKKQTKKQSGTLRPIVLNIGGRTLKKFVIDVMNEQMNPRKI